jgi:hypothetical protein
MKNATTCWWPVELWAFSIGQVVKVLPIGSEVKILLDSEDLAKAFEEWSWPREHPNEHPGGYTSRSNRGWYSRSSRDGMPPDKSGSSAIWGAEETMVRAVAERDNPSGNSV